MPPKLTKKATKPKKTKEKTKTKISRIQTTRVNVRVAGGPCGPGGAGGGGGAAGGGGGGAFLASRWVLGQRTRCRRWDTGRRWDTVRKTHRRARLDR